MEKIKRPKYYNMAEAWEKFTKRSSGFKEKSISGSELVGKGSYNVARYTITEIVPKAIDSLKQKTDEINEFNEKCKSMSDRELLQFFDSDRFKELKDNEKRIVFKIIRDRGLKSVN